MYKRFIQDKLKHDILPGRALVVLGARRVGKTTLIKIISKDLPDMLFLNCDDVKVRNKLENIDLNKLYLLLKSYKTVIFDEAQRVKDIGLIIKMIIDEMPEKYVIVSGSSSLDLANSLSEPLTGRKKTYSLYPLSFGEIISTNNVNQLDFDYYADQMMRFGGYPDVWNIDSIDAKIEYLLEISSDYLYKDVLEYQQVKNHDQLKKMLIALSLQIGSEVSQQELARMVGVDQKTIARYIDLLEKSFVIFQISAFSRNMRNEINRNKKIYFYDLGIRNALINNFNELDLRNDVGALWENFLAIERIKKDQYQRNSKNYYFWRTYDQKEIDWIEEANGQLDCFEFKWKTKGTKTPKEFLENYPNSTFTEINRDCFGEFITK